MVYPLSGYPELVTSVYLLKVMFTDPSRPGQAAVLCLGPYTEHGAKCARAAWNKKPDTRVLGLFVSETDSWDEVHDGS